MLTYFNILDGYDQPSVVNANEEKIAEANEYQDGGYVPGTYCQNTYYRSRSIETREKWDPVPYKAVLIKKGRLSCLRDPKIQRIRSLLIANVH